MNAVTPRPLFSTILDRLLLASAITGTTGYLEPAKLLNAATRKTGLDDFGEPDFLDAFNKIADSIDKTGALNAFGRFALRNYLTGNLVKRLTIIEFLKCNPEIINQRIEAPVFITGWYRTGTTYLHNLVFTCSADARAPLLWELMNPCPNLETGITNSRRQILRTRLAMAFQGWISPAFQSAHPLNATQPDECLHLMENAGLSSMVFFLSAAKNIAWQQLDTCQTSAYRFYRQQLQLLNWQRPGRRWVLKWPYHLWHLDSLLSVFPDAKIIWLQRDPVDAVPSVCNLAELAKLPFCNDIDRDALGQFWLSYNKRGQERAEKIAARGNAILKIDYAELLRDQETVLTKIARHVNMKIELPGDSADTTFHSGKQYSAQDYGLTSEIINSHFQ